MEDCCNSPHWKVSLVDSSSTGNESSVFGLSSKRPGEDFQIAADSSFGSSFPSPFDWNDEQLGDLIAGENVDSGDHVVPYPYQSEKSIAYSEGDVIINQFDSKASNVKPADRKKTVDLHQDKLDANEAFPASAFAVDSWNDFSLSNATIVDEDLLCPLESNKPAGILGELDSDSGFFAKLAEDMVNMDYLDDLHKIFSNDNQDICQASLPCTQKLGMTSKDVTSIHEKSIDPPYMGQRALRSISGKSETKTQCMLVQNEHSTTRFDTLNDITRPNISRASREPFINEKIALETDNQLQDLFSAWPVSFGKRNNHNTSMNQPSPSLAIPQPLPHQYNPQSMQLQYHIESKPYTGSSLSMDCTSEYSMPGLPRFHGEQGYHQAVPCSSYASTPDISDSLQTLSDRHIEGFTMTPKKKIEKLRRNQQMKAMAAIQNLQHEFYDHIEPKDHSVLACRNLSAETQSHLGGNGPNMVTIAGDDRPDDERILHQLQDIILKLGTRTKLNIRDSFFRLAENARQRQKANNTSSITVDSNTAIPNKEDINSKVEAETNQIDRAVAHLLFHQPPETPKMQADKFYY